MYISLHSIASVDDQNRRIQYLQRTLRLGAEETRARCRKALNQALELGLPEKEIRAMAKLSAWQLAP